MSPAKDQTRPPVMGRFSRMASHVIPWLRRVRAELREQDRRIAKLTARSTDQKRQIKDLEKVASRLAARTLGDAELPPEALRMHVGRVAYAGNFWAQGLDSSDRVIEVFGEDPGGPVLDWGCGSGRTHFWLRGHPAWAAHYRGCDVDAEAVAWLKARRGAAVEVCGDHPPLPYPDASLEGLFCFSVLTHIHPLRHRTWYQEIRRVLKPGGRAYVTVHGDDNIHTGRVFTEAERRAYAEAGWSWSKRKGHYKHAAAVSRAFTRAALEGLFEIERYHVLGYHSMDDLIIRRL